MSGTAFKILDTLSRDPGTPISVNELTRRVRALHGTAYYANVYRALRSLNKQGIISIEKSGRSSLTSLGLTNYLTLDLLTEMELRRKREILETRPEFRLLVEGIDKSCQGLRDIVTMALIEPERNIRLNRAELLVLRRSDEAGDQMDTTIQEL